MDSDLDLLLTTIDVLAADAELMEALDRAEELAELFDEEPADVP
jgi:hypothetical protein